MHKYQVPEKLVKFAPLSKSLPGPVGFSFSPDFFNPKFQFSQRNFRYKTVLRVNIFKLRLQIIQPLDEINTDICIQQVLIQNSSTVLLNVLDPLMVSINSSALSFSRSEEHTSELQSRGHLV